MAVAPWIVSDELWELVEPLYLPQELGYGSGYTCRRRLDEWQRAGVSPIVGTFED